MKKLSFFLMAMLFSVMSFAAETVAYTLTPAATGANSSPHNSYASAADWTYEGITWNVTGNSYMVPWRIGGKSITAQDRAVYTKTAMAADITKIEITHATVNITCNSCTLTISDAANGDGETFPVEVTQNTTTTITLPEGDYSNKFYKLVYNVTNTTTSNKYVQLSEIKFYTEVQTSVEAPTFTPEEGKVAANNTFAEPFALTIASATTDATIKYTLDGTDPTLETALTYEAPITISTMVQVRAIAVKGEEKSVEASVAYIISSSEAKPYTASEAIAAEALGLTGTVYVTGTVKSIEELSTQYGNATYNITDGTKELKIYRGKNLENAKFTSADQLLVGDVVVVKGDLTSYNGAAQLGQNNYLISRITAPTTYTVTVTAENGAVEGAGVYEEGKEATLTATPAEGYKFVNWTSGETEVSTANPFTFTVTSDTTLVANFEEAAPEYALEETVEISNLTTDILTVGDATYLQLTGRNDMLDSDVQLFLNNYTGEDKEYEVNVESSLMTFGGLELTVVEGKIAQATDPEKGQVYTGRVIASVEEEGEVMLVALDLVMYATPPVELEIIDAVASVDEATGALVLTAEWTDTVSMVTYPVSITVAGYNEADLDESGFVEYEDAQVSELQIGDDDNWFDFAVANAVAIFKEGNAVAIEAEYTSWDTGATYYVYAEGEMQGGEDPEYWVIEDEITNLVFDPESTALIGGPSTKMQVEVFLGLAEDDNMDGQWSLSPESSVTVMGFDARIIDGYVYDIDVNAPAAKAVLRVEDSGFFYEYRLNMTYTPTEATVVVIEDATVAVNEVEPFPGAMKEYSLTMTANWTDTTDNTTYPVLVEVPAYDPNATEPLERPCTVTIGGNGDTDPWLGFGEGTLTITTVDGVVTAKGIVVNPYTKVAFDVTISGKLPQGPGTGLDNVQVEVKTVKMIKNGQLIINRDGKSYNAQGATLK